MGRRNHADVAADLSARHIPYTDEALLESEGLREAIRDADHGRHGPPTLILSRRELDRAKEEDSLRIGLLGPMM